mmetsp:Transcript_25925/g.71387  ORF Transcript_25925/g.71387 Transcript_25925/m.71387 type:complete len:275 (-) Transcript_25925:867-1691(-)
MLQFFRFFSLLVHGLHFHLLLFVIFLLVITSSFRTRRVVLLDGFFGQRHGIIIFLSSNHGHHGLILTLIKHIGNTQCRKQIIVGCHLDRIAPLIDGNLRLFILLLERRRKSSAPHDTRATSHHETHPRIVRRQAHPAHLSLIVEKLIMKPSLHGRDFQIRMRIDLAIFHVAVRQRFLFAIIGSVRTKVVTVLPRFPRHVSFDADQGPTVQIGKDGFVRAHGHVHFQQDKVFATRRVGNDRIGPPSAIGDEQTDGSFRGGKAAQRFPRHDALLWW